MRVHIRSYGGQPKRFARETRYDCLNIAIIPRRNKIFKTVFTGAVAGICCKICQTVFYT